MLNDKVKIDQRSTKIKKVPLRIITSDMLLNEENEKEGESEYEGLKDFFGENYENLANLKRQGTSKVIDEAYIKYIVAPNKMADIKFEKKTKKLDKLEQLMAKYEETKTSFNENMNDDNFYKHEEEESDTDEEEDRNDFDYDDL